jgi:hypothetical protein
MWDVRAFAGNEAELIGKAQEIETDLIKRCDSENVWKKKRN